MLKLPLILILLPIVQIVQGNVTPTTSNLPRTHVINGVFIRYSKPEDLVYTESTSILWTVKFEFTPPQPTPPGMITHCETEAQSSQSPSFLCLFTKHWNWNLSFLSSRLHFLISSITNQAYNSSSLTPFDPPVNPITLTTTTTTTTSTSPTPPPAQNPNNTTAVPRVSPPPSSLSFDDAVEALPGRRRRSTMLIGEEQPTQSRSRRQLLAIGIAGSAIAYLGHKIYNYFDHQESPVTSTTRLTILTSRVRNSEKQVYQLGSALRIARNSLHHGFTAIFNQIDENRNRSFETNIHSSLHLSQLTEKLTQTVEFLHYQQIIKSCSSSRLSPVAINPKRLHRDLSRLTPSLTSHNKELVIPVSHLSAYYHHDLCKCHVDLITGQVHITLEVPIKPVKVNFRVAELFSLDFYWTQPNLAPQICRLQSSHEFAILIDGHAFPISPSDTSHCRLALGICKFQTYGALAQANTACIRALLSSDGSSNQRLLESCPILCRATSKSASTVVSLGFTDGWHNFAITAPPSSSHIRCKDELGHSTLIPIRNATESAIGTYMIQIKCGCSIIFGDEFHPEVSPPFPCQIKEDDTTSPTGNIKILIPSRWSNLGLDHITRPTDILEPHKYLGAGYESLDSIFNSSWYLSDALLNVSRAYNPQELDSLVDLVAEHHDYFSPIFTATYNIIFITVLSVLYIRQNRLQRRLQLLLTVDRFQMVHAITEKELSTKINTFLLSLGIFNIIILLLVIICLYACCRRRNQRIECTSSPDESSDRDPPYQPASSTRAQLAAQWALRGSDSQNPPAYPTHPRPTQNYPQLTHVEVLPEERTTFLPKF